MKEEIIRQLKSCGGYLSGEELSSRLHVSRTAVWKVIRQLREEGYRIEAAPRKGYRLICAADVLTEAECRPRLAGCRLGNPVYCYGETDSTNVRARVLAEEGALEGTLVTAESQTAGRGRRGRSWISPPGDGLWFSFLLRPEFHPYDAPILTLAAALAVSGGIRDVCGLPVMIKWPNDIVLSGKKVAGILTELSAEAEQIRYVVVGVGINVNIAEFPEEIRGTATSLYLESGCRRNRCDILAAVMKRMEEYYEVCKKTRDLSGLMESYTKELVNLGREVSVISGQGTYRGICEGIDRSGRLLVRRPDGTLEKVLSGEVSVRGVYGYV